MAATNQDSTAGAGSSSAATARATLKSGKQTKRVILRLQPSLLQQFPSPQPPRKASRSKPPLSSSDNQSTIATGSGPPEDNTNEREEVESKPSQTDDNAPGQNDSGQKRKGVPGPKPGQKRSAPSNDATNETPKPRGKPGPKKRKLDGEPNGTNKTNGTGPSHHKLGPKANQGAINAGLRALDRTGKPCRRWDKQGFALKSFTGVSWLMPTWTSPTRKPEGSEDAKSENTASSDVKPEQENSMVGSEKSNNGGEVHANGGPDLASSPGAPIDAPTEVPNLA